MPAERLSTIYRTNYTPIGPDDRRHTPIFPEAKNVILPPEGSDLLLSITTDHGGNHDILLTTSQEDPTKHGPNLNAFLAIDPDKTYKARPTFLEENSPKPNKDLVRSIYLTTEEDKNDDLIQKFEEATGEDLLVAVFPEHSNRIVIHNNERGFDIEVRFPNANPQTIILSRRS